jgi:hypothetical protein
MKLYHYSYSLNGVIFNRMGSNCSYCSRAKDIRKDIIDELTDAIFESLQIQVESIKSYFIE